MNFGDRLQILRRFRDEVQVRTEAGVTGWVSQSDVLSSDFWKKTQDLEAEASKLPVEARGHTHVISNMHIDPARDSPRIRQLNKDVPVDLIERRVAAISSISNSAAPADAPAQTAPSPVDQTAGWTVRSVAKRKTGGSFARTFRTKARRQDGCWDGSLISTCPIRCVITPARQRCESWRGSN